MDVGDAIKEDARQIHPHRDQNLDYWYRQTW